MSTPARKPATNTEGREEGIHARLMREMKSKRGYDPMPPAQHEWQFLLDAPPDVSKMWSWMCAGSLHARMVKNEPVRTAGVTLADGVTRATLSHFARAAKMDLAQASRAWKKGELLGLWYRNQKGFLCLNGEVSAAQVTEANEKRKLDSTINLSPAMLLEIKKLHPDKQKWFFDRWNVAQEYRVKLEAAKIAEARATCSALECSLLEAIGQEKKRTDRRAAPAPELPPILEEIVRSMTVPSTSESTSEAAEHTRTEDDDDEAQIFEVVRNWMRAYPQEFGCDLGEPDPAIVRRVVKAMNGARPAELQKLSDRMHAQSLAPKKNYAWFVPVVEEEFRRRNQTTQQGRGAGEHEGSKSSTSPPLESEAMRLADLLVIAEHTAGQLLESVRGVAPDITPLETACLARRFQEHSPNARNPIGLLLARLHTHAKGATLVAARREARDLTARHPEKYRTAGGGQ